MRHAILLGLALPLALAGCNAGRSAVGGVEQVGAGLGDAVTAPLEDFNPVSYTHLRAHET